MSFPFENSEQRTRVKYDITTMTIAEFMLNILPITDCNPIGQRPGIFLEPDNDKNVGIITNILNGEFLNCITLVDASKDSDKWTWESLDGGHRKRAIRDFFDNKFSVNGWTYATLPDELKEISEKVKSAEDVIKETDKTIRDKTIIVNRDDFKRIRLKFIL